MNAVKKVPSLRSMRRVAPAPDERSARDTIPDATRSGRVTGQRATLPQIERRKRILVVDDSATALMLQTMILSSLPCEIVTAVDGAEAVELASRESFDLVVMDMIMPKMDGLEACRRLRDASNTKSLPIILVTTRAEPHDVRAGYENGCTDYVTKPVDRTELLTKARSYLGA